jgi:hypothetical protein
MLPTDEIESGLLLTPSTIDIVPSEERFQKRTEYRESVGRKWSPGSLTEQIYHGMLPTPVVSDMNAGRRGNAPRDGHNPMTNSLKDAVNYIEETSKCSQLNPQFVLEMMGFPKDWTLLPFLSGETNPSKQEATQ